MLRITTLIAVLAALPLAAQQPAAPAPGDSVPLFGNLGALHHAVTASPAAQRYFDQGFAAAQKRYSAAAGENRAGLDSAYANAMRDLARRYPDDADAQALFAESMLDLSPWDNWTPEGTPKPGTEELVAALEGALAKHPDHPGACHFYIHAVEASLHPERALPCAERLPSLMPGAGHLVHMPAHLYIRVGRYADATRANEHAAHTDQAYLADRQPKGTYPFYLFHNLDFLRAASVMEGRSAEAIEAAKTLVSQVPVEVARQVGQAEMILPTHALTLARFGRWSEVLAMSAPPADLRYASGIWHYARGLALAGTGRFAEARTELDSVAAIAAAVPAEKLLGFHRAKDLLEVAHHALAGEIALRQGRAAEAIPHLEMAVRQQDALRYDEPQPWYYPVRQSLGAALLAAGRAADAERVYRDDLLRNPHNGWSLYGLAQALRAQHRDDADVRRQLAAAWARADVTLTSSRF